MPTPTPQTNKQRVPQIDPAVYTHNIHAAIAHFQQAGSPPQSLPRLRHVVQANYDALNRAGYFRQGQGQQIGHLLRAQGYAHDPTQGGAVDPNGSATHLDPYGSPTIPFPAPPASRPGVPRPVAVQHIPHAFAPTPSVAAHPSFVSHTPTPVSSTPLLPFASHKLGVSQPALPRTASHPPLLNLMHGISNDIASAGDQVGAGASYALGGKDDALERYFSQVHRNFLDAYDARNGGTDKAAQAQQRRHNALLAKAQQAAGTLNAHLFPHGTRPGTPADVLRTTITNVPRSAIDGVPQMMQGMVDGVDRLNSAAGDLYESANGIRPVMTGGTNGNTRLYAHNTIQEVQAQTPGFVQDMFHRVPLATIAAHEGNAFVQDPVPGLLTTAAALEGVRGLAAQGLGTAGQLLERADTAAQAGDFAKANRFRNLASALNAAGSHPGKAAYHTTGQAAAEFAAALKNKTGARAALPQDVRAHLSALQTRHPVGRASAGGSVSSSMPVDRSASLPSSAPTRFTPSSQPGSSRRPRVVAPPSPADLATHKIAAAIIPNPTDRATMGVRPLGPLQTDTFPANTQSITPRPSTPAGVNPGVVNPGADPLSTYNLASAVMGDPQARAQMGLQPPAQVQYPLNASVRPSMQAGKPRSTPNPGPEDLQSFYRPARGTSSPLVVFSSDLAEKSLKTLGWKAKNLIGGHAFALSAKGLAALEAAGTIPAQAIQHLRQGIEDNQGIGITIYAARKGRSFAEIREALLHEKPHLVQYKYPLRQSDEANLVHNFNADDELKEAWDRFQWDMNMQRYPKPLVELPSRLASGEYRKKILFFDDKPIMPDAEAEEMFALYADAVRQRHGGEAAAELYNAAPRLRRALRANKGVPRGQLLVDFAGKDEPVFEDTPRPTFAKEPPDWEHWDQLLPDPNEPPPQASTRQ